MTRQLDVDVLKAWGHQQVGDQGPEAGAATMSLQLPVPRGLHWRQVSGADSAPIKGVSKGVPGAGKPLSSPSQT